MKRITIAVGDDSIDTQARIYAEYRVFAAWARHARRVRRIRVVLRHTDGSDGHGHLTCAVTVALEPAGSFRIRARGPHVYAAINRAVERLTRALDRLHAGVHSEASIST